MPKCSLDRHTASYISTLCMLTTVKQPYRTRFDQCSSLVFLVVNDIVRHSSTACTSWYIARRASRIPLQREAIVYPKSQLAGIPCPQHGTHGARFSIEARPTWLCRASLVNDHFRGIGSRGVMVIALVLGCRAAP